MKFRNHWNKIWIFRFKIVFCSYFSLKDLVYFLDDVGRLLFWRSFENYTIEDIFGFIDEIFFEDNSLVVKEAFHNLGYKLYKCVIVVTCLALTWVWGMTPKIMILSISPFKKSK